MSKKMKERLFYVQRLINDTWITECVFRTFEGAKDKINSFREEDARHDYLDFYRVVVCSVHRMEIIDFN